MPTHKQLTVETTSTERGNGKSDTTSLQKAYPASPIHSGDLNDETIREMGNELLISEEVDDGGHTFNTFNRDYAGAPDVNDVVTGGGGLPGSPHAPNVASPGEGLNPSSIPADGAEITVKAKGGGSPFPGDGLESPDKASRTTSAQKIGSLIFGKSEPRG